MELRDYLKLLRRRWLVVLGCVLVATAATTAITLSLTPKYGSTVRLFVSTPQGDVSSAYQGGLFSEQRVESYADLVTGPEVAQRVIDRFHLDQSVKDFGKRVTAKVIPRTVILSVTVTDPDPGRATRLAAAVGTEFISLVDKLETAPDRSGPPIKASVLGAPLASDGPVSPRPIRNAGIAAAMGLLLGIVLAVLRDVLDSTIRDQDQLTTLADAPVLGVIAFDPDANKQAPLTSLSSHTPRAEAFRVVRTNLQFVEVDQPSKVFVITSSMAGEGKSTTACSLAVTLAQAGQSVALVDGDLRRPSVAEYLRLEPSVGLTTVLIGRVALADAMQSWGDHGLCVLTSGAIPPDPADLLQSKAMVELLADLRRTFDVVIIDAPPLLPVTDAALLTAQAEGALLVVRHGKTSRDQVRRSVERLASVRGRLVGTLLNRSPQRGPSSESYGYGYAPLAGQLRADREAVRTTTESSGVDITR
ncbi:polysaccharide biosynthesis tyrosine autokinase [Actinopolymorpha alba]|uniref:polysaccharide biosynthesis tyrosine autokinase n=1 Tax=Actinopolymorpha alba TaxID=533267 RepID=UPI000374B44D|nr:polysaccharide biosynthesis tyrosine autokinase [Actinopolymorpha alba]